MAVTYMLDGATLEAGQSAFAGLRDVTGDTFELIVETDGQPRIVGHGEPAPGGGIRVRFTAPHFAGEYTFGWLVDGKIIPQGGGRFTVIEPEREQRAPVAGAGARIVPPATGARINR